MLIKTFVLSMIIITFSISALKANYCNDYEIWNGAEPILSYGIDSTNHWWAITQPFSNRYRLIVDGEESETFNDLTLPVFSPDGNRWASFVNDNGSWYLYTNDTLIYLPGNEPGEIIYSPDSGTLAYSYLNDELETIVINDRTMDVYRRQGKLFISNNGYKYAFMGYRAGRLVMNINGEESPLFDDILPLGFWHDGNFVYVVRRGNFWQAYKGNEEISESYFEIRDPQINLSGTVMAFAARRGPSSWISVLVSDEYWEPLTSRPYDMIWDVTLHPHISIVGFKARLHNRDIVVMNNTEYFAGEKSGDIEFSFDGEEMYFVACDIECFVSINGKRYQVRNEMALEVDYALKPNSETIAYPTSTSLVIQFLTNDDLVAGMMVDEILGVRYNWRDNRYEAIGRINQRLYLLTCRI